MGSFFVGVYSYVRYECGKGGKKIISAITFLNNENVLRECCLIPENFLEMLTKLNKTALDDHRLLLHSNSLFLKYFRKKLVNFYEQKLEVSSKGQQKYSSEPSYMTENRLYSNYPYFKFSAVWFRLT